MLRLLLLALAAALAHACSLADLKGAWSVQLSGTLLSKGKKGAVNKIPSRILARLQVDGVGHATAKVHAMYLVGGSKFAVDFASDVANSTYTVDSTCFYSFTVQLGSDTIELKGLLNAAKNRLDVVEVGEQMNGYASLMSSTACTATSVKSSVFQSEYSFPGPKNSVATASYVGSQTFNTAKGTFAGNEYVTPGGYWAPFNGTYTVNSDCTMVESIGYWQTILPDGSSWYISTSAANGFDFGFESP